MAFNRPTLAEILERVKGDIKSGLGVLAILRRSFLNGIARALAGTSHVEHGHLEWISKQVIPTTADTENLLRWGSFWIGNKIEATYAQFIVTVTGNGTVNAGDIIQREDGTQYEADTTEAIVVSGPVSFTALVAGEAGNVSVADELTFLSPNPGIDSTVTVASITIEADDEETNEAYLQRIIDRVQEPPAGGKCSDYVTWAKEVAGVTRAWVYPGFTGLGTVGVTFVEDGEVDIFPSPAKVAEVQTKIDEERPVTATAIVFAPTELAMNPQIQLKPNTAAVQAAVQAELDDLIFRDANPKGAQETISTVYDGKILLSRINEAISIAAGEEDHILDSPTADVTPTINGELVSVGTITFITLP